MEFLRRNKVIAAFIAFSLFCIISLSVQSSVVTLSFEGVGSAIVMPFQKLYYKTVENVHLLWAGLTELKGVRIELQKTRDKLHTFESLTDELTEIKRENDSLRQMLTMQQRIEYEAVPAKIISKDPDNWYRTIIINRGSKDGITKNMPVIAYNGDIKAIAGIVTEVRGSVSRIRPIISPDLKIGVMLQESRYPGLLTGHSTKSNLCIIDYISKSAPVKADDIVITSGQGGIFPAGIFIGRVVKADMSESSAFQRIMVKPYIDFDKLEDVFIIKKIPDDQLLELLKEEE